MTGWNDDDCWSDAAKFLGRRQPSAVGSLDEGESVVVPQLITVEEVFVGSVYWISDRLWKIPSSDRAHPGVCVRCDLHCQRAVFVKGTSVRSGQIWRYDRFRVLVVEPTAENELSRSAAFALEPRDIDLRIPRRVHLEDGPRGRVAPEVLRTMEEELAYLERALTEGPL